jgi:hypothetical protein
MATVTIENVLRVEGKVKAIRQIGNRERERERERESDLCREYGFVSFRHLFQEQH